MIISAKSDMLNHCNSILKASYVDLTKTELVGLLSANASDQVNYAYVHLHYLFYIEVENNTA